MISKNKQSRLGMTWCWTIQKRCCEAAKDSMKFIEPINALCVASTISSLLIVITACSRNLKNLRIYITKPTRNGWTDSLETPKQHISRISKTAKWFNPTNKPNKPNKPTKASTFSKISGLHHPNPMLHIRPPLPAGLPRSPGYNQRVCSEAAKARDLSKRIVKHLQKGTNRYWSICVLTCFNPLGSLTGQQQNHNSSIHPTANVHKSFWSFKRSMCQLPQQLQKRSNTLWVHGQSHWYPRYLQ